MTGKCIVIHRKKKCTVIHEKMYCNPLENILYLVQRKMCCNPQEKNVRYCNSREIVTVINRKMFHNPEKCLRFKRCMPPNPAIRNTQYCSTLFSNVFMQRKKLKVTFQNPLHNFNLKYHNMYEVPVLYYINYINLFKPSTVLYVPVRYRYAFSVTICQSWRN